VIFHKEQPVVSSDADDSSSPTPAATPTPAPSPSVPDAEIEVTDEEREAITFTGYDLEVHLAPAHNGIAVHAGLTVRNDGKAPLTRLALQLSSSLVWSGFGLRSSTGLKPLTFVQHRINTDADHTGVAREAVVTLPAPLAPGGTVELTALYAGEITLSGERLERIGAPAEDAVLADWDAIEDTGTFLRGYGNVLWYPVVSAPVFLGDGAKLFESVGTTRLRQQPATVRLRLAVEYRGEAPDAAYFCGRRAQLTALSENEGLPVAEAPGIATAEFAAQPIGFRVPSLFVTEHAPTVTDGMLLSAVTDQFGVLNQYAAAAAKVQPLLMDWLGTSPLGSLNVLDHDGQPFEDKAFLVAPLRAGEPGVLAPVLVHTLAHAWFGSSRVWLDEGVAQLMSLLWVETQDGREAALTRLQSDARTLALAEPEAGGGQDLLSAHSEAYYRIKAAAVLWMLRSVTSDDVLKKALQLYRKDHAADQDPQGFEHLLERTSGKDLEWLFEDWVYHDRGLPDLSIVTVAPRQVNDPGVGPGAKSAGWLVAIDVRNDGDAVAEVPVTVRSGTQTATERLRIAAHSNAATRVLFQGTPEEISVNDGSVPEMRTSVHTSTLVLKKE